MSPRTDLQSERVLSWNRSQQVGDRKIRVYFLMGDPTCYGVRARVHETPDAVHITVLQGSLPNAPEQCSLEAAEASLLVTSPSPVAGRRITQPSP